MKESGYRIQAVLFDFDGTLSRPGALDFKVIRRTIGCPDGMPVLEFIQSISNPEQRHVARQQLEEFEVKGAAASREHPDAAALVHWLKAQGLSIGIITRNSRASLMQAFENFESLQAADFDLMLTRDDPIPPKPSGEGVVRAAGQLKSDVASVLVVGDYIFDSQAGRAAGALTALLDPEDHPALAEEPCDFRIRRLAEVKAIVAAGIPLPAGKLPNELLARFLGAYSFSDPSVILHPGVGEDVTAVELGGDDVVVLKSDPITFATDAIGHYVVSVNANDIVTAGAVPRWFLTTLLLPCGVTPSQVEQLFKDLFIKSRQMNITLCGGHTEITDAVGRPLVVGMMAGAIRRDALIDKKQMREGDSVILTKGVPIEGTAILAREFGQRLMQCGVSRQEIAAGRRLLDQISVWPEAGLAAQDGWASAMHDVTEGGLATALSELSVAGGHGIRVSMETIPILSLAKKFCSALSLNPLGLIGSGALLICCRPRFKAQLMQSLKAHGILCVEIGEVLGAGAGIQALEMGKPVDWPEFAVDEIARLF